MVSNTLSVMSMHLQQPSLSWSPSNVMVYSTGLPASPILVGSPSYKLSDWDTKIARQSLTDSDLIQLRPLKLHALVHPLPTSSHFPEDCTVCCNLAGSIVAAFDSIGHVYLWKIKDSINQWSVPHVITLPSPVVHMSWINQYPLIVNPKHDPSNRPHLKNAPPTHLLSLVTQTGQVLFIYPTITQFRQLQCQIPITSTLQMHSVSLSATSTGSVLVAANSSELYISCWLIDFVTQNELRVNPIQSPVIDFPVTDQKQSLARLYLMSSVFGTYFCILHPSINGLCVYSYNPSDSQWTQILHFDVDHFIKISVQPFHSSVLLISNSLGICILQFGQIGMANHHITRSQWMPLKRLNGWFVNDEHDLPPLETCPHDPERMIFDAVLSPNMCFVCVLSTDRLSYTPQLDLIPVPGAHFSSCHFEPIQDQSQYIDDPLKLTMFAHMLVLAIQSPWCHVGDIVLAMTLQLSQKDLSVWAFEYIFCTIMTTLIPKIQSPGFSQMIWSSPYTFNNCPLMHRIIHTQLYMSKQLNLSRPFSASMAILQSIMTLANINPSVQQDSNEKDQSVSVPQAEMVIPTLAAVMWIQDWCARALRQLVLAIKPWTLCDSNTDTISGMHFGKKPCVRVQDLPETGVHTAGAILLHPGFAQAVAKILDMVEVLRDAVQFRSESSDQPTTDQKDNFVDSRFVDQAQVLLARVKTDPVATSLLLKDIADFGLGLAEKHAFSVNEEVSLLCGARVPMSLLANPTLIQLITTGVRKCVFPDKLFVNEGIWLSIDRIVPSEDVQSWVASGLVQDSMGTIVDPDLIGLAFTKIRQSIDVVRKVELGRAPQMLLCTTCGHFAIAPPHTKKFKAALPQNYYSITPSPHVWATWADGHACACVCGGRWWHMGLLEQQARRAIHDAYKSH